MSAAAISGSATATDAGVAGPRRKPEREARGSWWRFLVILVITAVVLVPIIAVVLLSLQPALGSTSTAKFTLENFVNIFSQTDVLTWLKNSLTVTVVTVVVSVAVAAPAGYVLVPRAEPHGFRVLVGAVHRAVAAHHHRGDPAVHPVRAVRPRRYACGGR